MTEIKTLPIEINKIILPLDYNYAVIGDILVKTGDKVSTNQPLTKIIPNTNYSVALHSPVNGYISNIGDYYILQENGTNIPLKKTKALEITTYTPNNTINYNYTDTNLDNICKKTLLKTLNQLGIIGLGGAGFPSAKKLESNNISTLIVNAVECEPPIIVDHGLIINYSENIIHGLIILDKILKPETIIIAIKASMADAIQLLESALESTIEKYSIKKVKFKLIPDTYPNGYSKTLIKLVTSKQIDNNQHSSQTGIICLNIGTVFAIEQALVYQQPLINRIVTIVIKSGNNLTYENYQIPIGTPISTILLAFKIDLIKVQNKEYDLSIKIGGDYMGFTIFDSAKQSSENLTASVAYLEQISLEKTTQVITIEYQQISNKDLSVISKITSLIQEYTKQPRECIKCGFCEPVCPMNLMPQQLYWFSKKARQENNFDILEKHYITNCIECGLCDQVCPSNIPLAAKFKYTKSQIKAANYKNHQSLLAKTRNDYNKERLQLKEQAMFEQSNNLIKSSKTNKKNLLASALKRAQQKKTNT